MFQPSLEMAAGYERIIRPPDKQQIIENDRVDSSFDKNGGQYPRKGLAAYFLVPEVGLEPTWALSPLDFESSAYTDFATPASNL